jgi:PAS domain S-box-containing protein
VGISRSISERKQAEDRLRESQSRLHSIFSALNEGVALHEVIHDADGRARDYRFVEVNPGFEKQTGIAIERVRGRLASEIFPTRTVPYLELYEHVARTGKAYSFETFFTPLERHFFFSVSCPEPGWLVTVCTDIARRKQAEETLRNSEERAKALFEHAPDAYFLCNLRGVFLGGNKAAEKMMGYKREELIGKSLLHLDFLDQEDLTRAAARLIDSAEGAAIEPDELTLRRKDGSRVVVEISSYPIRMGGETIVLAIARDITTRKRAQEEHSYLATLVNGAEDAIVGQTPEGIVASWNPAAERILGYRADEMIGQHISRLIPEDLRDEEKRIVEQVKSGDGIRHYETIRLAKDGTPIAVSLAISPIKDAGGKTTGVSRILRDLTETKRAQQALQQSEQRLRTSRNQLRALAARLEAVREDERTRIAREIHDELGGAMTTLKMDICWLERQLPPDAESRRRIGPMLALTDRAMLFVQRISSELRPGLLDHLGLGAAVEWLTEQFQERTGIHCHAVLPATDIHLDKDRTTVAFRIFQELLNNVARHARATRVDVRLRATDREVLLEVKDNGRGITRQELANPASLGLLGMKERVFPFGGEVTVAGVPGKGTVAAARIPLRKVTAHP